MEITEVRIKLMEDPDDRLQAFCSITIDDWFVVRDLKIIEGASGPFVAMPSRKLTFHCRRCGCKNHLRANYCNQCGAKMQNEQVGRDSSGRVKLYADIAHPINAECRDAIQKHVIAEFEAELERAEQPGYRSRYDEGYEVEDAEYSADAEFDQSAGESELDRPQSGSHRRIETQQTPAGPHKSPKESQSINSESAKKDDRERDRHEKKEPPDTFGAGIFD